MAKYNCSAFADEAANTLEEQIAACKTNGIAAIELRGVDGRNISDLAPQEAQSIKETLDAAGIAVSAIGSKYGKEAFHLAAFRQTVEVAKVLGAKYIRMFSFYEGAKEQRFADVKAMYECAKEADILCCHENEKGIYGDTPERCLELLEAVPGLGCVFDFANFMECGADPMAAYALLKPYITYIHIKDYCGEWKQVVPAGWGDGHIAEILRDFDESRSGAYWLSLEPHLTVFEGLSVFDAETKAKLEEKKGYASRTEAFAQAAASMHEVIAAAQPVRLGIIGYGNMGTGHAGNYRNGSLKGLRVTAVADIRPERLEAAKHDLPGVALYATAAELIGSGSCDAVLIATPHYLHPPIAIAALEAGLHVMTEKPAGVYTKQVQEMNEAAAKSDKIFAIMYNQRSEPVHQKLRELVQSGEYGALKRVVWIICDWYRTQAYYNSGGWRATWAGEGGGVLTNQCPHQLDLWQWICGMPCKISAHCKEGLWHDIEVEDDVTIYAEYPNGATGAFITTTGEAAGTNRLEITMDRAKLISEGGKLTLITLDSSTQEHIDNAAETWSWLGRKQEELEIPTLGTSQHAAVLNAFVRAILTDDRSALYARGEEGINGLSISNAAYLSSWLGRAVELPVDEALYLAELQKKIAGSKAKTAVAESTAADMSASYRWTGF